MISFIFSSEVFTLILLTNKFAQNVKNNTPRLILESTVKTLFQGHQKHTEHLGLQLVTLVIINHAGKKKLIESFSRL